MAVQASIHLPGKASMSSNPVGCRQAVILYRGLTWSRYIFVDTARKPRFYLQVDGIPDGFENISPSTPGKTQRIRIAFYIFPCTAGWITHEALHQYSLYKVAIESTSWQPWQQLKTGSNFQNTEWQSEVWFGIHDRSIDNNKTQAVVVHRMWAHSTEPGTPHGVFVSLLSQFRGWAFWNEWIKNAVYTDCLCTYMPHEAFRRARIRQNWSDCHVPIISNKTYVLCNELNYTNPHINIARTFVPPRFSSPDQA